MYNYGVLISYLNLYIRCSCPVCLAKGKIRHKTWISGRFETHISLCRMKQHNKARLIQSVLVTLLKTAI